MSPFAHANTTKHNLLITNKKKICQKIFEINTRNPVFISPCELTLFLQNLRETRNVIFQSGQSSLFIPKHTTGKVLLVPRTKNRRMKISIVTPAFNSAKTIRHTIESVARQTYPNVEYIIVDGGSHDATARIVAQYSDVVDIFISEPDRGVYDAMNKGIRAASGDVIAILNSDDFYTHAHVLEQIANSFQESGADSVYGNLQYVDQHNPHQVIRHWESGAFQRQSFLAGWMPPHPAFFVKRTVYQRYGLFNLSLKSSADYELMLRFLYKHQVSAAYVSDVLVRMRTGGLSNATWLNRWRANREDRLAWKINGINPRFYTTILKPFRKLHQFYNHLY